jgi:tripartite-type tricarboxylate transporter receptor subunit TctC
MKLSRRRFLRVGAAALAAAPRLAWAQAYPTRPVRIVVAAAPGGANDIVARLMAPWLAQRLGQFIVENRPGGSNNIGTEAVVRAPPDGYALLLVDSTAAINATLYDKLNFVFLRDIAPVAGILRLPYVLVVHPSVPAATVAQLIAYAKANPGRINMASPGTGTGPHVAGELFKIAAGIDMVHVPYRGGGPVMTDLLGGQVQVLFGTTSLTIEQIRAGKLRALAVTTADILDRLNREVNAGLADAKLKARLTELGGTVLAGSPADFGKLMAEETEKWAGVIRAANIKPE